MVSTNNEGPWMTSMVAADTIFVTILTAAMTESDASAEEGDGHP